MVFFGYLLIFVFLLVLLGVALALSFEKSQKDSIFGGLETSLFLVMMPTQAPKKEGQVQEEEKSLISQMEQVFANFLYIKKPKAFGRASAITLEIASQHGGSDISFYVCVPKYLETVFEKYVQGVYAEAVIEKVPQDYTVFEPQGKTAGAYFKLKENFLFPISTYQKLEKDPLAIITNDLSKISEDEGAAIQLIIRPLTAFNIRKKGEKALSKIREGKNIRSAIAEATQSPLIGFISEIFKSTPKKDGSGAIINEEKKEQGLDQIGYDAIASKIQKPPFEVNIRIVASAKTQLRAQEIVSQLTSGFNQFSLLSPNSLKSVEVKGRGLKKFAYDGSFRVFNQSQMAILNTEELASLYHFPTHFTETPYIKAAKSSVAPPPADLPETGTNLIGKVFALCFI